MWTPPTQSNLPTATEGNQRELQALTQRIAELGISAETLLSTAIALLDISGPTAPPDANAPLRALATERDSSVQQAVAFLGQADLSGDQIRRAIELQQNATAWYRIGELAREIAHTARALDGDIELLVLRAGEDTGLLPSLLASVSELVRGAVIVCASRDTALARELASRLPTVTDLCERLQSAMQHAIAFEPLHALPLHHVTLLATQLNAVTQQCNAIFQAVLYTPTHPRRFAVPS